MPTRDALIRRGIISQPHEVCCVFCFRAAKTVGHLFFECPFSYNIWSSVLNWVGLEGVVHRDCIIHFMQFGGFFKGKKN